MADYVRKRNWSLPVGTTKPPDVPKWLGALADDADLYVDQLFEAQKLLAPAASPIFTGVARFNGKVQVPDATDVSEAASYRQAKLLATANRAHYNFNTQAINTSSTLVNGYSVVHDPTTWLSGNGTGTAKVTPKVAGVYTINLVLRFTPHTPLDKSVRFARLYRNGVLVAEDIREPGWTAYETVCQAHYIADFNGTTDNVHVGAQALTNIDGTQSGSTLTGGRLIIARIGGIQ